MSDSNEPNTDNGVSPQNLADIRLRLSLNKRGDYDTQRAIRELIG